MAQSIPHNTTNNLLGGESYAEGERLQREAQAKAAPKVEVEDFKEYSDMLNKYLGPKGLSVLIAMGITKPTENEARFLAFSAQVAGDDNFIEVWEKLLQQPNIQSIIDAYVEIFNQHQILVNNIKSLCPVNVEGKTNGE